MRRVDYHTHNGYYRGSGRVWDAAQGWKQAQKADIELLAITPKLESKRQEFIKFNHEMIEVFGNSSIFNGVEVDIRDPKGSFLLEPDSLKYVDLIMAGPHNVPYQTLAWPDLDAEDLNEYFGVLEKILQTGLEKNPVDVWVHPFLQELEISAGIYYDYLERIFRKILVICEKKKIAVEINANYFRKRSPMESTSHLWDDSPRHYFAEKYSILKDLFKIAYEEFDVSFSFGSDSHDLARVGDIDECIDFADQIGIGDDDILLLQKIP